MFGLLLLALVMILLAMYMVDRQWAKMASIEHIVSEQAQDLRNLRTLMSNLDQRVQSGGVTVNAGDPARGIPDAFQRAYAARQMENYATGGWLIQAFGTGLKTITPLVSSDVYAAQVQNFVLESLLTRNPETLAFEGLLAEDNWEVTDGGLTFTFNLRQGIRFSDGHELDASDVAFSFAFIMNESIAAPRERAYFEKIDHVTATDQYQIVFRFKEPYFDSLALAGNMPVLAQHFYERYLEQPERFNQSKGLLFGSGPYRLRDPESWTPDQGLVELEHNPRYWAPVQPPFERLLWKVIENESARLATFRNGEIDTYDARPREYQRLLKDQSLTERTQHFSYMSPTAGYTYIGWNQERNGQPTRFADQRVRQAMTYLTDRERIIKEIWQGYAEPAVSPFSPRSPQHDPNLTPRPFDLEKAKALLAEAGYEDRDGDRVLEGPEGEPFEFELVFFQDNEDTKRMALLLKDLYARAGILLQPKPTEWSVMLDLLNQKDFDAITLGWSSGVETDIFQMFHSTQSIAGGDNFISYENPRLDQLIKEARATVEEDRRMPLWHACERILYQDQPYTFLIRRETLAFIDARIQNLEITNLGLNLNTVPMEIFVPGPLQKYGK